MNFRKKKKSGNKSKRLKENRKYEVKRNEG